MPLPNSVVFGLDFIGGVIDTVGGIVLTPVNVTIENNTGVFNGSTSKISGILTSLEGVTTLSISTWFKSSSAQTGIVRIGMFKPGVWGEDAFTLKILRGDLYTIENAFYDTNVWVHVVIALSANGVLKVYKNGSLFATSIVGSATSFTASEGLEIGVANTFWMDGNIGQFYIFNAVLSDIEAQDVYERDYAQFHPSVVGGGKVIGSGVINAGVVYGLPN